MVAYLHRWRDREATLLYITVSAHRDGPIPGYSGLLTIGPYVDQGQTAVTEYETRRDAYRAKTDGLRYETPLFNVSHGAQPDHLPATRYMLDRGDVYRAAQWLAIGHRNPLSRLRTLLGDALSPTELDSLVAAAAQVQRDLDEKIATDRAQYEETRRLRIADRLAAQQPADPLQAWLRTTSV